jgi:hypothetical protein
LGGLHVKHATQRGIWVPTQNLLLDVVSLDTLKKSVSCDAMNKQLINNGLFYNGLKQQFCLLYPNL